MSPRLAFALDAVHRAGRLTLKYFQTGVDVDQKKDKTPVTAADREAERLLRKEIAAKFPGEPVLGEEEGLDGQGDDRWVIDPIDGTKSFVCGVPLYANLLSYERAGEPILGVCYFPALDEMLYAETGAGAFLNGRVARVSAKESLDGAAISCGSIVRLSEMGLLPKLIHASKDSLALRTWSDAYGHALVATGRVDAMVDPVVNHWDISALAIIVEEAGGRFSDLGGGAKLGVSALSGNPALHPKLVEALNA